MRCANSTKMKSMKSSHLARFFAGIALLYCGAFATAAQNPGELVLKAVAQIEAGEYALARVYLEPALIDPRLTANQRSRAYYLRGYSFLADGFHVSAARDYHRALEFNPSNPVVQNALGHLFTRGLGVTRNLHTAFSFFLKAARGDHPPSKIVVGLAFLNGEGVERNTDKARFWFNDALEDGLVEANTYLGHTYRAQFTDEPDPELARATYETAIEAGSVDAMVALGYMHNNAEFGAADFEKANELFTRASNLGSPLARALLGYAHLEGNGVPVNDPEAYRLLTEAAAQGSTQAYRGIAYLFESGRGVAKNTDEALAWYAKAGEAGDQFAQLHLGFVLLQSGDLEAGGQWLARAADSGVPQGQNDYAWALATNANDAFRNGKLALHYAILAVAQRPTAQYVDTLAAAYAELGDFATAITEQERAIGLVPEGDDELLADLQSRLKRYQASEPWRD